MIATAAQAVYRRVLERVSESVTFRRESRNTATVPPTVTSTDQAAKARVVDFAAMERHAPQLVGQARQGDHLLIVLVEDLSTWGEPVVGDKVVMRSKVHSIEVVDKFTRAIAGTVVAYNILVRG